MTPTGTAARAPAGEVLIQVQWSPWTGGDLAESWRRLADDYARQVTG